jgi:hypothetical protein
MLSRPVALALLAAAVVIAPRSAAQYSTPTRVIEEHPISDPEGALMGYYSALMIFAPDGAPAPAKAWTVDLTANLGYVPPLSYDQRTAGRDKPESTNLTEIFGYPKVTLHLPYNLAFEAAYTLPVNVSGATPNIYSFGLSILGGHIKTVDIVPRVTYTGGHVTAPITCNKSLSTSGNPDFEFYYMHICNNMESTDRFEPDQWSLEVNGTTSLAHGAIVPFINIGLVQYHSTFDIQVRDSLGGIDTDHPILKLTAVQGYGTLGATWVASPLFQFGGALFWAPGSVVTGRLSATLRLNGK